MTPADISTCRYVPIAEALFQVYTLCASLMSLAYAGKAWITKGVPVVVPCLLSARSVRRRPYHRSSSRHPNRGYVARSVTAVCT